MANERLYQFPSKASPVPADIIYAGDSAAGFDEVNITIAQLISAYPNLSGIGGLTLGNNTFIYANGSAVLTAGSFSALAVSLVADTTISQMQSTLGYTATPSASLFAGWDAHSNLTANNLISGYATTPTAGGTTTLTVSSPQSQYFTGTLNQTIQMPVTSTLVLGQYWSFVNLSSGTLTIQSSGGNTITTVGASQSTYATCILTSGTTAASWSSETPVAGSGVVNSGTINNLAYYAATGSTVSSLGTANNGILVTSNTGVPSILAGPGSAGLTILSQAAGAPIWSTNKPITKINRQIITATGTYTASAGLQYAYVQEVGGGAGSGGAASTTGQGAASGGGGAGGYNAAWFTGATIGASQSVTIGAAGTEGTSSTSGGNGGQTSFGALLTANGGTGSANASTSTGGISAGGAGGTTSTGAGIFAVNGQAGETGVNFTATSSFYIPGTGGSPGGGLGVGGLGNPNLGNTTAAAVTGTGYGAGASGAGISGTAGAVAGAAGTIGIIIIDEFISV